MVGGIIRSNDTLLHKPTAAFICEVHRRNVQRKKRKKGSGLTIQHHSYARCLKLVPSLSDGGSTASLAAIISWFGTIGGATHPVSTRMTATLVRYTLRLSPDRLTEQYPPGRKGLVSRIFISCLDQTAYRRMVQSCVIRNRLHGISMLSIGFMCIQSLRFLFSLAILSVPEHQETSPDEHRPTGKYPSVHCLVRLHGKRRLHIQFIDCLIDAIAQSPTGF